MWNTYCNNKKRTNTQEINDDRKLFLTSFKHLQCVTHIERTKQKKTNRPASSIDSKTLTAHAFTLFLIDFYLMHCGLLSSLKCTHHWSVPCFIFRLRKSQPCNWTKKNRFECLGITKCSNEMHISNDNQSDLIDFAVQNRQHCQQQHIIWLDIYKYLHNSQMHSLNSRNKWGVGFSIGQNIETEFSFELKSKSIDMTSVARSKNYSQIDSFRD